MAACFLRVEVQLSRALFLGEEFVLVMVAVGKTAHVAHADRRKRACAVDVGPLAPASTEYAGDSHAVLAALRRIRFVRLPGLNNGL